MPTFSALAALDADPLAEPLADASAAGFSLLPPHAVIASAEAAASATIFITGRKGFLLLDFQVLRGWSGAHWWCRHRPRAAVRHTTRPPGDCIPSHMLVSVVRGSG